jgi:RNA polymerase sigma factor (sigma-70 family)
MSGCSYSAQMDTKDKNRLFCTTQWSVVLRARGDSQTAAECLEKLCAAYWYPLYAFLRRRGSPREEAEDLTQGFFTRLLSGKFLDGIHPAKGRFRNFLLASLKNFAANEWDKALAQKRGGNLNFVSLEALDPESRYAFEIDPGLTAEKLFDRRWALTVIEQAFALLREELGDKQQRLDVLKPLLMGEPLERSYKELAQQLHTSEGALKVFASRLPQRFAVCLRQVINATVETPEQREQELQDLMTALSDSS